MPLLRAALERFGIPARFYSGSILAEHAAAQFLAGVVDLMLGGWDHAETLAILKLAPGLGSSAAMDKFDFAVRAKLPGNGLEPLLQFAGERSTPEAHAGGICAARRLAHLARSRRRNGSSALPACASSTIRPSV